jgi:hypothetical protein
MIALGAVGGCAKAPPAGPSASGAGALASAPAVLAAPGSSSAPGAVGAPSPEVPAGAPGGPTPPAAVGRAFTLTRPRETCSPEPGKGWQVCGETSDPGVELTSEQRARLEAVLNDPKSFKKRAFSCFTPRHVFALTVAGGLTSDVLVCFECAQVFAYDVPPGRGKTPAGTGDTKPLSRRGFQALQALCRDAGLRGCDEFSYEGERSAR